MYVTFLTDFLLVDSENPQGFQGCLKTKRQLHVVDPSHVEPDWLLPSAGDSRASALTTAAQNTLLFQLPGSLHPFILNLTLQENALNEESKPQEHI